MKKILMMAGVLLASMSTQAQTEEISSKGCATVMTEEEMDDLYRFVHEVLPAHKGTGSVDSIPLTIHIVGENNGAGYYKNETLLKMLCKLNERYVPTGFFFYLQWPIRFINNSNYYIHNYNSGYQMMATNNVANTVNVYFVQDPAGACGYFSYGGDAVAISKNCAGIASTTLTHELGHYFGLPHTFNGWENGATPANPEKVTRGAGANCSTTGDLFCDTEADYLGARWTCPYGGYKLDANGEVYHPDSSIYMSYSLDACMSRFSEQQMARMRYRLQNNRPNLLVPVPAFGSITDSARLLFPIDTMYANQKFLKWSKVPGATHYYVKMRSSYTLSNPPIDTVVTDTFVVINANLTINNYSYLYSVTPLNGANLCMDYPAMRNFIYTTDTKILSASSYAAHPQHSVRIAPNPAVQGVIHFSFTTSGQQPLRATLYNTSGQEMTRQEWTGYNGWQVYSMNTKNVAPGIYFLKLQNEAHSEVQRVIIE